MIDCHIHYASSAGAELLNTYIAESGFNAVALQCIPKGGEYPTEGDALAFKAQSPVPVYVFGGIGRQVYALPAEKISGALLAEVERLMGMGCTGIKMLEGKPDVRKHGAVPDFDNPLWDAYWSLLEEQQIPILFHVNDPEEFWDISQIDETSRELGWYYDESYINNEEQYRQIYTVLERHPRLRITFAHFFFMSKQLERLGAFLDAYGNVRIDLTPGIEMFYNLSEQSGAAKAFFHKYQDRICFGTDTGSGCVVVKEDVPLSMKDSKFRFELVRDFLATEGAYVLEVDKDFIMGHPYTVMHGLGLPEGVLEKIYEKNFLEFIAKP